jgi:hypothetical protein
VCLQGRNVGRLSILRLSTSSAARQDPTALISLLRWACHHQRPTSVMRRSDLGAVCVLRMAYDPLLTRTVHRIFRRAVCTWLRRRARRQVGRGGGGVKLRLAVPFMRRI